MTNLALFGQVDVGKTTFYKKFSKGKIKEHNSTTEVLRSIAATKLRDTFLIDIPGHIYYLEEKKLALTMADLILYIVDCNNPDFELLKTLNTEKPVLILLNKVDSYFVGKEESTLKNYVKQENQKTLNDLIYTKLFKNTTSNLDKELLLFTEGTSKQDFFNNYLVFPISLKTSWGLNEFVKYYNDYVLKIFDFKETSYLYKVQEFKDIYHFIGKVTKGSIYFKEKNKLVEVKNLKYNQVSDDYEVLPSEKEFFENKRLFRIDSYPENSALDLSELDKYELLNPDYIRKMSAYDYLKDKIKILIKSKGSKMRALLNIFRQLKFNIKEVEIFPKAESDENTIFVDWVESKKGSNSETDNFIIDVSLYNILKKIETSLENKLKKLKSAALEKLNSIGISTLLGSHIFKKVKQEIVIGSNILWGQIRAKEEVVILDKDLQLKGEAHLNQLQINKKSFKKWNAGDEDAALNLKFKSGNYDYSFKYLMMKKEYQNLNYYRQIVQKKFLTEQDLKNLNLVLTKDNIKRLLFTSRSET